VAVMVGSLKNQIRQMPGRDGSGSVLQNGRPVSQRSADSLSAVSPNGIRQRSGIRFCRRTMGRLRINNPRHSRLTICATVGRPVFTSPRLAC